ncbi:hypothetical protein PsorP6_005020 [Peronosclerospora sorghi]|uniref:Uncharacterized protein n=1 Tax=Peronosclerospora sorghi TaxID=230839 RepID=A0ACC0W601_9STRA|nr:hypothetical protein PsorP6_005020 [Peronosclerospora sorghi]
MITFSGRLGNSFIGVSWMVSGSVAPLRRYWGVQRARTGSDSKSKRSRRSNGYSPVLGSDEPLEYNVRALKRVANGNIGHMVARGPAASVSCHWSNNVNTIGNVLLEMEHEEMELNFHVGDALVALGHDALGTSETAHNPPQARVLLERVLSRGDASRHRKQRRKATILLLCMCAAGLTTVPRPGSSCSSRRLW